VIQSRYSGRRSFVVEAILKALAEHGPMTRRAICRVIGRERNEVASVVSRLNKTLPTAHKRVYVCDWVHDEEGSNRYPRAVYALGDKPDKRKPEPETHASVSKRWRDSQKLKVISIFELGISPKKRHEQRRADASRRESLQQPEDSAHALQHGERP